MIRKFVALSLVFLVLCCREPPDEAAIQIQRLRTLVPSLSETVARHLVQDTPSDLRVCLQDSTRAAFRYLLFRSLGLRRESPQDSYAATRAILPYLEKLESAQESKGKPWLLLRHSLRYARLDSADYIRLAALNRRVNHDYAARGQDRETMRYGSLQSLLDLNRELNQGYPYNAHVMEYLGWHYLSQDRPDSALAWWERAVDGYEQAGIPGSACYLLGAMGIVASKHFGTSDSTKALWDHWHDLATQTGSAIQLERWNRFQGTVSLTAGRYGEMTRSLRIALDIIHRENSFLELAVILQRLETHLNIEAMHAARLDLYLLSTIIALNRHRMENQDFRDACIPYWLEKAVVDSYRQTAAEADSAFAKLEFTMRHSNNPQNYDKFMTAWAATLLRLGADERVLEVADRARRYVKARNGYAPFIHLALIEGEAHYRLGDLNAGRGSLNWFRRHRAQDPGKLKSWDTYFALTTNLALQEGHTADAVDSLRLGLRCLEDMVGRMDGSAYSYLILDQCRALRKVTRDLLQGDAAAGYAAELLWHQVVKHLDTPCDHRRPDCLMAVADIIEQHLQGKPWDPVAGLPRLELPGGGRHLLYQAGKDSVYCWVASGEHVQRRSIPLGRMALQDTVDAVMNLLSYRPSDPDAALSQEAAACLARLAGRLLPPDLGPDSERLWITADGPLAILPFAALNLSQRRYAPLAQTHPVVMLRGLYFKKPGNKGEVAVVACPAPAEQTCRLYSGLADLPCAEREADDMRRRFKVATSFEGTAATAAEFVAEVPRIGLLYYAGHVGTDPEFPYLAYLVFSEEHGQQPGDELLLVEDIRRLDLSGMRLVVLSGCSTGRPYLSQGYSGASVGDAFLDSGASAVVQTLWPIRDDDAEQLMQTFQEQLSLSPDDPIKAFDASRRLWMAGPDGKPRHPFLWAAYNVSVNRVIEGPAPLETE